MPISEAADSSDPFGCLIAFVDILRRRTKLQHEHARPMRTREQLRRNGRITIGPSQRLVRLELMEPVGQRCVLGIDGPLPPRLRQNNPPQRHPQRAFIAGHADLLRYRGA